MPPVRLVLRVLAGLSTLTWWVLPAMGIADLTVTWDPDWPVMLEAGWGLLCTVGLGAPFLLAALAPRLARAALVQVLVVAAALAVAAVGGQESPMWWFFALLVLEVPVLFLLGRGTRTSAARNPGLLVLAALGAPPALAYAWAMLADNRALHFDGDITMGVDHDAVQAALALTLVSLPVVAGLGVGGAGAAGRRLLGTSAALMAGYLGLVGYQWVGVQADLGDAWALATMAWAAAVLVGAWWPAGRPGVRSRVPAQGTDTRDLPVRK
jgi:hypothetical protein